MWAFSLDSPENEKSKEKWPGENCTMEHICETNHSGRFLMHTVGLLFVGDEDGALLGLVLGGLHKQKTR